MSIPILNTLSTFTSEVVKLKRNLVNKGLVDSNAKFYQFADKIAETEVEIVPSSFKLGPVKNIRFSIIDNILNICYEDPDSIIINEVVVARHGTTTLRAKIGSYPTSHSDGVQILSETHKNKYIQNPFSVDLDSLGLIELDEDQNVKPIYFRFFSATAVEEVWNDDADLPYNMFTSSSYDWDMIYGALKDFPTARSQGILPEPGSIVYIDYIISDYYMDGATRVQANTRQAVVENANRLSATAIPFYVLGYNANVPQYVPYRRFDSVNDTYEYVYVQSVDDSVSVVNEYDTTGNLVGQVSVDVGTKQFRTIEPGARIYSEDDWNIFTNKKSYSFTGKTIQHVGEYSFGYDNEGTGKQYVYNVPVTISVDGVQYDFCGYTMTMQPVNCLGGVAANGSWQTGVQFDASENTYASPFNVFPSEYDSSVKYYTLSSDGIHEFDWSSKTSTNINDIAQDIYLMEDNQLKLQTSYYERYHRYQRYNTTTNTYTKLVEIFDFGAGEVYYPNCEPKNYDADYNMAVYADIVRYNGTLYLCKAQVPEGNT